MELLDLSLGLLLFLLHPLDLDLELSLLHELSLVEERILLEEDGAVAFHEPLQHDTELGLVGADRIQDVQEASVQVVHVLEELVMVDGTPSLLLQELLLQPRAEQHLQARDRGVPSRGNRFLAHEFCVDSRYLVFVGLQLGKLEVADGVDVCLEGVDGG